MSAKRKKYKPEDTFRWANRNKPFLERTCTGRLPTKKGYLDGTTGQPLKRRGGHRPGKIV